jgi:hypothetical protein
MSEGTEQERELDRQIADLRRQIKSLQAEKVLLRAQRPVNEDADNARLVMASKLLYKWMLETHPEVLEGSSPSSARWFIQFVGADLVVDDEISPYKVRPMNK